MRRAAFAFAVIALIVPSSFAQGDGELSSPYKWVRSMEADAAAGRAMALSRLAGVKASKGELESAARLYREAAGRGDIPAMMDFAEFLEQHPALAADGETALHWFEEAARRGNTRAAFYLEGLRVLNARDDGIPYREVVLGLRARAKAGDAGAQFLLCRRPSHGAPNFEHAAWALEWCRKAADAGHAGARFRLANHHLKFRDASYLQPSDRADPIRDAKRDETEGVKYLRLAAADGHPGARSRLALLLATGAIVEQDLERAAALAKAAADQDETNAQALYGVLLARGFGVERDVAAGVEYLKKAAAYKNDLALCSLSYILLTGYGGAAPDGEEALALIGAYNTPEGPHDIAEEYRPLAFQDCKATAWEAQDFASPDAMARAARHYAEMTERFLRRYVAYGP